MAKAQLELPSHKSGSGVGTLLNGDKSRGICLGTGGKSGQRAHGLPALVQRGLRWLTRLGEGISGGTVISRDGGRNALPVLEPKPKSKGHGGAREQSCPHQRVECFSRCKPDTTHPL